MNNDRNSPGTFEPEREKAVSGTPGSEHNFKSGDRTFTEPDNPPEKKAGSQEDSDRSEQNSRQETGGPNKPTA